MAGAALVVGDLVGGFGGPDAGGAWSLTDLVTVVVEGVTAGVGATTGSM